MKKKNLECKVEKLTEEAIYARHKSMASLTTTTTTTTSDTITIGNNTGIQVDVIRSNDNIILSEKNFERILDVVKQLEGHITTLECENNTPNAKKRKSKRSQPMKKKPHDHKSTRFEVGHYYYLTCKGGKKVWFEVVSRTTKTITIRDTTGDTDEYRKSVVDKFGSKAEVIGITNSKYKGGTFLCSWNKGDPEDNNNPRKSNRSQPMKKKPEESDEDVFESGRFTDENTTPFFISKEVNFAAVKTAPEFIAVKIAPITNNPTTSNPHDHKSDMMKGGIAGENKGNQQMDWWDSTERIEFLIAMFEDTVEGAHIDILDGAIVDIATDPLTNHEVVHLLTSITFGKLCNILTPIEDEMRTNWNQDPNVLIAVSKNRVSQKEILIKFNVTDASNRVTTLKDMYKELYEMKEIELEQSMMNKRCLKRKY